MRKTSEMTLEELKGLDREVLDYYDVCDLEFNEHITDIECLGISGDNKHYWYDVQLEDGDNIDVYTDKIVYFS